MELRCMKAAENATAGKSKVFEDNLATASRLLGESRIILPFFSGGGARPSRRYGCFSRKNRLLVKGSPISVSGQEGKRISVSQPFFS
jgi:hypothetical protein